MKEHIFSPRPPKPAKKTTKIEEEQYVMVNLRGKEHTQLPPPIPTDHNSKSLKKTAVSLFKFIVAFY